MFFFLETQAKILSYKFSIETILAPLLWHVDHSQISGSRGLLLVLQYLEHAMKWAQS